MDSIRSHPRSVNGSSCSKYGTGMSHSSAHRLSGDHYWKCRSQPPVQLFPLSFWQLLRESPRLREQLCRRQLWRRRCGPINGGTGHSKPGAACSSARPSCELSLTTLADRLGARGATGDARRSVPCIVHARAAASDPSIESMQGSEPATQARGSPPARGIRGMAPRGPPQPAPGRARGYGT